MLDPRNPAHVLPVFAAAVVELAWLIARGVR